MKDNISKPSINKESWIMEHILPIILFGAIGVVMVLTFVWFPYQMTNPNGPVQQALKQEQDHLDSIKSDCRALGKYVLDSKGELLDPIVREARDLYMVNCK